MERKERKGFSLIELLVVITIIMLLTLMIINFDFSKKTDTEKRDRFIQKIESLIHTSKNVMLSGKGVPSGAEIINPETTHLLLNTGSVGIYYYSGSSVIGTGDVLTSPFYGEIGYALTGAYWQEKNGLTHSGGFPVEIIFNGNGEMEFSGSISSSGTIFGVGIQYRNSQKTLEFDRRFGKILVR